MEFKLTSPAFNHGSQIPSQYTCDGDNISPHLAIHGAPQPTKSLALLLEDLDVPADQAVHWVLWNINPEVKEIKEHSTPRGSIVGVNSRGKTGYDGPCPPSGMHRYVFRLYALDIKPKLAAQIGRSELEAAMELHILATAELSGTYSRTNEAPR